MLWFNLSRSQLFFNAALLCLVVPFVQASDKQAKTSLYSQFKPIIASVSEQLLAEHEQFKKNPQAYQRFLDQHVRPYWDSGSTARALIGSENFKLLAQKNQQEFVTAVDKTLIRYAFEGIGFYSGQQFQLVDVAISDSGKMGWVQVLMRSKILPDLNLDILVKRNKTGVWMAVDVRLKGITYVAVKKYQFKKILEKQGVGALIANLNEKNNSFFGELCALDNTEKQSC